MNKKLRFYRDFLVERLQDPQQAYAYLEVAIEGYEQDGDDDFFLQALRNVAEAQGGIGELAKRTNLNRPNLYRALSKSGNPRWGTINAVLRALGVRLTIEPLKTQETA